MNSYSTHSRWTQAEEKLNVFFKYDQYLYISVCLREPGKACCPLFLYYKYRVNLFRNEK